MLGEEPLSPKAASSIKDGVNRAEALSRFVPHLAQPEQVRQVKRAVLQLFKDGREHERSTILYTCSLWNLITPRVLVLSQEEFARIIDSISAITTQWHWM